MKKHLMTCLLAGILSACTAGPLHTGPQAQLLVAVQFPQGFSLKELPPETTSIALAAHGENLPFAQAKTALLLPSSPRTALTLPVGQHTLVVGAYSAQNQLLAAQRQVVRVRGKTRAEVTLESGFQLEADESTLLGSLLPSPVPSSTSSNPGTLEVIETRPPSVEPSSSPSPNASPVSSPSADPVPTPSAVSTPSAEPQVTQLKFIRPQDKISTTLGGTLAFELEVLNTADSIAQIRFMRDSVPLKNAQGQAVQFTWDTPERQIKKGRVSFDWPSSNAGVGSFSVRAQALGSNGQILSESAPVLVEVFSSSASGGGGGGSVSTPTTPTTPGSISVGGISPTVAYSDPLQVVTITGTGFQAGADVTFNGVSGTNVTVIGPTSLTVELPSGLTNGAATVVVTNPDDSNATGTLTVKNRIFVKQSAVGANNGSTWTDAFTDLQSALTSAVSGDEVWVAVGTYKPDISTDRTQSFVLPDGVAAYGGFAGNATDLALADRDPSGGGVILSGDLDGDDSTSPVGQNSYHVVKGGNNATLDGFVIQGGLANDVSPGPDQRGGGIVNENVTNMTLGNLRVEQCEASTLGAGMYSLNSTVTGSQLDFNNHVDGKAISNVNSNLTLSSSTIQNNSSGGVGIGGAVQISGTGTVMFDGVNLLNNTFSHISSVGGAIKVTGGNASLSLQNSQLEMNQAGRGAAISFNGASLTLDGVTVKTNTIIQTEGAVSLTNGTLTVQNSEFKNNQGTGTLNFGAGLYINGGGTANIRRSFFLGNQITNNNGRGAAVYITNNNNVRLENLVFEGNICAGHGGAFALVDADAVVFNSTFFQNQTADPGFGGGAIYFNATATSHSLDLTNSILNGNAAISGPGAQMLLEAGSTGSASVNISHSSIPSTGVGDFAQAGGGGTEFYDDVGGNVVGGTLNFISSGDVDGTDNQLFTSDDGLNLAPSTDINIKRSALTAGAPTNDITGATRTVVPGISMGAYEQDG